MRRLIVFALAASLLAAGLGARDLGRGNDYRTAVMPPQGILLDGAVAWRQHDGGMTAGIPTRRT